MPGKAKVLSPAQLMRVIRLHIEVANAKEVLRDICMLLITVLAGLRAQEVAYLEKGDVVDVEGNLDNVLHVSKRAGKYGKQRDVPLGVVLRAILEIYIDAEAISRGPLFLNQYGLPMTPNAVQKQLGRMYHRAGYSSASSHSGRRTYLTQGSRDASRTGSNVFDIQELAGHANLETTAGYVEAPANRRQLVDQIEKSLVGRF